jgi:hypothetical protein
MARITVNMWNLNLFAALNTPGSLIASVDIHFVNPEIDIVDNASNCVQIDAEPKKMVFGN